MPEYSKEQLWKIYELLPDELKTAIFAEETAENISTACNIAGINREKISEVARLTGHVLMGLLPPEEFSETLEKEVGLDSEKAKRVSHQITRLIFNPLKESLARLYEEGFPEVKKEKLAEEKPKKEDIYREPIE